MANTIAKNHCQVFCYTGLELALSLPGLTGLHPWITVPTTEGWDWGQGGISIARKEPFPQMKP